MKRSFVTAVVVAAIAASLILFGVGLAAAHALYVRSDPPFGATLAAPPKGVKIWFSQELKTAGARIKVMDQAGRRVDKDDTKVSFEDPKMMSVSLDNIANGAYLVDWAVVSAEDGDLSQGSFTFQVGGGGAAPQGAGGAGPSTLLAGLALLISLVSLGASAYAVRRASS